MKWVYIILGVLAFAYFGMSLVWWAFGIYIIGALALND